LLGAFGRLCIFGAKMYCGYGARMSQPVGVLRHLVQKRILSRGWKTSDGSTAAILPRTETRLAARAGEDGLFGMPCRAKGSRNGDENTPNS